MLDAAATRSFLAQVDQGIANDLMTAFADRAGVLAARVEEMMWAIAMLKAACLASVPIGPEQERMGRLFSDLLSCALPAAILRHERATSEQWARPQ